MDRPPAPSEIHPVESAAPEQGALVAMIEALHRAILTKADPAFILEELDALARVAERRLADEKTRPAPGGSPRARIPRGGGETFVARLRVFRQRFGGEPNASDQAQLYDFLSEWLIDALYED
jgi:hypothetical protein